MVMIAKTLNRLDGRTPVCRVRPGVGHPVYLNVDDATLYWLNELAHLFQMAKRRRDWHATNNLAAEFSRIFQGGPIR